MDKEKKDKVIGIFGILLFISSMLILKIFAYYQIVFGSKILTFLIILTVGMWGVSLSMRYFNQLFKGK